MLKILLLALVAVSQAAILRIPYTGGKQTGTFTINASGGQSRASYADTVIIDSNLSITHFMANISNYSQQCFLVPAHQYGLALKIQNGLLGKLGKADTLWSNSKVFADTILPLDTVPKAGYISTKDLGNSPRGLNVDTLFTDGVCSPSRYGLTAGYHNALYFKLSGGSGERYGKLMFYEYHFVPGLVSGGNNPPTPMVYTTLTMAYTLSNTKDLDSGPVGIHSIKRRNSKTPTVTDRSFDLNGRYIQKSFVLENRLIPIPLFSSKP